MQRGWISRLLTDSKLVAKDQRLGSEPLTSVARDCSNLLYMPLNFEQYMIYDILHYNIYINYIHER